MAIAIVLICVPLAQHSNHLETGDPLKQENNDDDVEDEDDRRIGHFVCSTLNHNSTESLEISASK